MERARLQQPKGWLSWLRYPLWKSSSAPPAASIAATAIEQHGDTNTTGLFFPFLRTGRDGEAEGRSCPAEVRSKERPGTDPRPRPQRKPRARDGPRRGNSGRGRGLGERTAVRVSRRRASPARAKEVQRLHKELPLIWQFLREEGWAYVKNTWDVQGPAGGGSSSGSGGGGAGCDGAAQQQRAGPMPQGQVMSFAACFSPSSSGGSRRDNASSLTAQFCATKYFVQPST